MTNDSPPLSAETVDRLRQATTATLASQLFERGFQSVFLRGLRPLCPSLRMVGVATTVRFVSLPGTYPLSEATRAEFETFRRGTSQPA